MSETIKHEGKEWEVLKDCGDFVVARCGQKIMNIWKNKKQKKEEDGQNN